MDQALADVFEQARGLVADADRKLAEAEEHRKAQEREAVVTELAIKVDAAFDFTSKEKLQLEQRLDMQDGRGQVEFVVRAARAMFTLLPQEDETWKLSMLQDGREPQVVGDFQGGSKGDAASRRLAAARIVTAIGGACAQKMEVSSPKKPTAVQPRWRDDAAAAAPAPVAAAPPPAPVQPAAPAPASAQDRREPTYGTFGKFLGY